MSIGLQSKHSEGLQYILENYIRNGIFEKDAHFYCLEEFSDEGRTKLKVTIEEENLCIANCDCSLEKKKAGCKIKSPFFNEEKQGITKCVDHVILQHKDDNWFLHLIEMKKTIRSDVLFDIRKKNRDAYFFMVALSSILQIKFKSVKSYTTYETDNTDIESQTNTRVKMLTLGEWHPNVIKEWHDGKMRLSIGKDEWLSVDHQKKQMTKNEEGVLTGSLIIE